MSSIVIIDYNIAIITKSMSWLTKLQPLLGCVISSRNIKWMLYKKADYVVDLPLPYEPKEECVEHYDAVNCFCVDRHFKRKT